MARAQQMMQQVLRDHPRSAQAHFVMAQVDAGRGDLASAQQELHIAEEVAPGLPFARPESVRALQRAISRAQRGHAFTAHRQTLWGAALVLVLGTAFLWLLLHKRHSLSNGDSHSDRHEVPLAVNEPTDDRKSGYLSADDFGDGSSWDDVAPLGGDTGDDDDWI